MYELRLDTIREGKLEVILIPLKGCTHVDQARTALQNSARSLLGICQWKNDRGHLFGGYYLNREGDTLGLQ